MVKMLSLDPVFDLQPLNLAKVTDVVCHRHISNMALLWAYSFKPFVDTIFVAHGKNTDVGVQKIALHNTTSFILAFLEVRMSSMISSAVLSSCQRPAKLLVHPFSPEGSETELATELLNSVMSSSFTLLLRAFSSDQYFAARDEVGDSVTVFMLIWFTIRLQK